MREYGQIQSAYWSHPDLVDKDVATKLLGAYLLTSQHTTGLGAYRLPTGYISIDLSIDQDIVEQSLRTLQQIGMISRDPATHWICIRSFLKWNPPSNPNSAKARVKEFRSIPSTISIYPIIINEILKHGRYFPEDFMAELETLSKGLRNGCERVAEDVRDNRPEQTLPEQTLPDTYVHPDNPPETPPTNGKKPDTRKGAIPFELFWTLYPRKESRKRAETAWRQLTVKKQRAAYDDIKTRYSNTEMRYIPLASSHIHAERWEDETRLDSGDDKRSAQTGAGIAWAGVKESLAR